MAVDARYAVFAREYVIDFNGTRAAIAAGYSARTAYSRASQLLNIVEVQNLIAERVSALITKLDLSAEKVLTELTRVGFSNILDYVTVKDGDAFVDLSRMTREQAAAVQEIVVEDYLDGRGENARDVRRVKFKLLDKIKSLELLGKHLKIFAENVLPQQAQRIEVVIRSVGGAQVAVSATQVEAGGA